jgi:hypothetical protein
MKKDEVDGISEPQKKKKKNKHKESDQSSENAECALMANNVEREKIEPLLGTKHKKRKRHFEDEGGTGVEIKKKKKKQDVEDHKSTYCETQEHEDLHFTHLSSEDAEYGTVLEAIKETYLGDSGSKAHNKKKKHKLCTDTNEGKEKETIAEVTENREHSRAGNGDEVMHDPDHAPSVKKMHKNKRKPKEKLIVDIPDLMTFTGVCKTSGKQVDNLYVSSTALASTSSSAAFPQTGLQESDLVVKDSPKAKKELKECDSRSMKVLDFQSKAEAFTPSQKSPIVDKVENNSCMKDEYCKAKKEKRNKRDLQSVKLSYMQYKNGKSTAKEESSVAFEKSAECTVGAHTENKNEEHIKTVPSTMELLNGAESLISGSASGQDDVYFSTTSSFVTRIIAALHQTGVQETDTGVKGLSTKAKKKRMKYDSHIAESFDVQNKTEACSSSQKSPVMNNLESNSIVLNHIAKKEKRKKHDSRNGELLDIQSKASIKDKNHKANSEKKKICNSQNKVISGIQSESDKPTAKEESLVGHDIPVKGQSLGSVTDNVDEAQVIAAPSIADLLNKVKSKLKVKRPKKHKKNDDWDETKSDKSGSHLLAFSHGENKRKKSDKSRPNEKHHNSKKSKDKTSVSFDPAALLAQYVSKFEATVKDDTANECHNSREDAVDSTTSNTSFRSSFSLTGAGMANAADRKRKKMNKGKADAMPVRRSLPFPPSSHSCIEADKPVGQDIVRSHSMESFSELLESPTNKCDVLLTPEMCLSHSEVSKSPKTGISDTVEVSLASLKEGSQSKLSFLSSKQVTCSGETPSRSILSQKGTNDSHLPTVVSASSVKNSREVSDVNSPKTKVQTPVSGGFMHELNVSKLPKHDKSHGSCSGKELIDASLLLPHHSDVPQRLKSPLVDSGRSAGMRVISPLQAKSVNEVSTDLVKETMTAEIKGKHKKKKKHKEKKSKTKDDKDREHIGKKQKKKKAQDDIRNKEGEVEGSLGIQNELVDRREEQKEANMETKRKQGKSKEKDTEDNLENLKILASKLLSSFLQQ